MKKISSIEELKQIEFGILCYVKDICEKNDLRYFLAGGTLLGAVRHKDFIPWDDDVDIMLPRKDYELLLEIIEKENREYRVISMDRNPMYFHTFAKIVDCRTELQEEGHLQVQDMGVNIDVFPIDGLPKKRCMVNLLFEIVRRYTIFWRTLPLVSKAQDLSKVSNYFIVKILRIYGGFISRIASLCRENHSDYVACVVGAYGDKEIVPRWTIEKSRKVIFRKEYFEAPVDYRIYLQKHYGKKYMELPPKAKQTTDHTFRAWYK